MGKKPSIRKTNRKGLTKAKWIEVIQSCLKVAGIETPKIEFTPEGINVEWFTIVPTDWEDESSIGKWIERGYEVIEWISSGYSYHEPPDVYERSIFKTSNPYHAITMIAKQIFDQRLGNCVEGFEMEDHMKDEEKYAKQMEEMDNEQATGKEPNRDLYDDYRDRVERHNRQVLSRL